MFRSGTRRSCGSLDVYFRPAPEGREPRVGVVVPRHGSSIIDRNRLRRRLHELLRVGWLPDERTRGERRDVLVRAKAPAYERSFSDLRGDLRRCLESS